MAAYQGGEEGYKQETATQKLFEHEWRDIYGVLSEMNKLVKTDPVGMRSQLIANPKFARAIWQAQRAMGIDGDPGLIRQVKHMTVETFNALPPDAQGTVMAMREKMRLPLRPQ